MRPQPGQKGFLKHNAELRASNKRTKFFDSRYGHVAVKVMPGEYYVCEEPDEMIVTVLGSCVAACIRNPITGVGGMNHFMLPEGETPSWGTAGAGLRYGNHAMEMLINKVLSSGCTREQLEVKVFGGANVNNSGSHSRVGEKNANFVLKYLENEGIAIEAADLGGVTPRRIHYFPTTGNVKRLLLRRASERVVFSDERRYQPPKKSEEVAGEIELFD